MFAVLRRDLPTEVESEPNETRENEVDRDEVVQESRNNENRDTLCILPSPPITLVVTDRSRPLDLGPTRNRS